MSKPLSGIYAALLTGFEDNGAFDADRQRALVDFVLRPGLTGLYVGGSSAEQALMTRDELLEQQAVVMGAVGSITDRRQMLIAHVGLPSIDDSIDLAKQAQKLGYDGLSALPPHGDCVSPSEIAAYYRALATATDLPMIVYEAPARTGRESPLEELSDLLALPGVAGLKYTSQDLFKFTRLRAAHPNRTFFFGFDEIYGAAAALGCDGGIGSTYNLLGSLYVALHAAAEAGDIARMRELQSVSRRLVEHLLPIGVIPGLKHALRTIGVDCGPAREPFASGVSTASDEMFAALGRFVASPDCAVWTGSR